MTNGITCCVCSISAISFLQFVLKPWQKRLQQDSGEERVTAKSRPMMSLIARVAFEHTILDFRKPGEEKLWKSKSLECEPGQPVVGSDPKTAPDYYHEQSIESSFSARYSKWDDNQAWSSPEWKTDTSMCGRSGQPVLTSW